VRFIETLFHISPDGGNGMTEDAILLAIALGVAAFFIRKLLRRGVGRTALQGANHDRK
jgi:hypothetical protein